MAAAKKTAKATPGKRRSVVPSAPEVKLTYATAGRETLNAIEAELSGSASGKAEAPVIEISETPAGRETMAAIAEELADAMRPRQNTLPYADKISNAPGARSPSRAPAPPPPPASTAANRAAAAAQPAARAPAEPARAPVRPATPTAATDEGPELTIGGETAPHTPRLAPDALEIFELLTFIIRGTPVGDLSTDAQRRRFVEAHLVHRLPSASIADVERIEVTPWTAKGTMVVRVWCKA